MQLPRLYPILDRACMPLSLAHLWMSHGISLLQYRNKDGAPQTCVAEAREIVRVAYALERRAEVKLIMNDRADFALAAAFDGVHVGQDDLSPEGARAVVGNRIVGVSCHNEDQIAHAAETDVDYLAIGPMFSTRSKANLDPEVGLARLAAIRRLTAKPLVAIGGINRDNCRRVWDAGADSVAVIADLAQDPDRDLEAWLALLG